MMIFRFYLFMEAEQIANVRVFNRDHCDHLLRCWKFHKYQDFEEDKNEEWPDPQKTLSIESAGEKSSRPHKIEAKIFSCLRQHRKSERGQSLIDIFQFYAYRKENGEEPKKRKKRARKSESNDEGPVKCDLCEKEFESKKALKRHENTHSKLKIYPCEVCLKMFRTIAQKDTHVSTHFTEGEFKCDECPYVAKRVVYLKSHMKRHRKEYTSFCEICQEGFFSKDKLLTHNIQKHDAQPFQCEICKKIFSSKNSFYIHNKTHIPLEERVNYQCELCGRSFNNLKSFR